MDRDREIREARPPELDEVENLVKAAYREFQPLMPADAWNRWIDNISETLQAPDGVVLGAGNQSHIQGGPLSFTPMPAGSSGAVAGRDRLHPAAGRCSRPTRQGIWRLLTLACVKWTRVSIPTIFLIKASKHDVTTPLIY
jgi:hypothetical protein